jgi:hypothetical protein
MQGGFSPNVINLRSKRGSKGLDPWAVEAAQPPPIIPLPLGGGRGWDTLCTTFLKLMTLRLYTLQHTANIDSAAQTGNVIGIA